MELWTLLVKREQTDTIALHMSDKQRSLPVIQYLTEVREELRRVSWPTRQQTLQKTSIVIVVSIIVGTYIGVLDFAFTRLMSFLIGS